MSLASGNNTVHSHCPSLGRQDLPVVDERDYVVYAWSTINTSSSTATSLYHTHNFTPQPPAVTRAHPHLKQLGPGGTSLRTLRPYVWMLRSPTRVVSLTYLFQSRRSAQTLVSQYLSILPQITRTPASTTSVEHMGKTPASHQKIFW